MSADNGYMSGENLEALKESPVDIYIATGIPAKNTSLLGVFETPMRD